MQSTFAITGVTTTRSVPGATLGVGDTLDLTLATDLTIDSVTLAGGVEPTLALSNGATAIYTGFDAQGLHFAYTVAAGQDSTGLSLAGLDLHGATVAHAATSGFAANTDYATGVGPYSVTSADVNADGKADLVTANSSGNTVSVLLGKGDGTFGAKRDYATLSKPSSVTAADVNGDGKADLVATSSDWNGASVLLGDGKGTFQAKGDYATGRTPTSVTSADVNGDGKADLVTSNELGSTVSVLLGNGDGTFQAKRDYATGFSPRSVTSADVNGDGKADLVTANNFGDTVSVLLGNGDGTFQAKRDYATGFAPRSVTSADVNGDGKADLVTANSSGNTVSVLLGNGDGTFQAKRDYATDRAPVSVVTADVNGDGKLDIVTSNEGVDTVSVLLGNGDGTFQAKQDYATGFFPRSVTSADVNGDGKADLVTANAGDDTVSVLLNTGTVASQLDASSLFGATTTTGLSIVTDIVAAISVAGATNLAGGHVVSGTIDPAAAGASVTLYDGTHALGTVASDADGRFALALTDIDGGTSRVYHLTASVTDAAGHTVTSAVVDYALDFTPNQSLFGAVTHDAASIGGQVYALYDGLLGRAPDALGLSFWSDAVAHGTSLHDVAAALLGSGEFAGGHGGAFTSGSDDAFVQHLYTVGLGRAADAGGSAYWEGQLAAGMSRVDVALSLALSPENAGQIAPALQTGVFVPDATASAVARLYDAAFGREPDGAGLASWTAAAKAGASVEAIMSGFLASAEGAALHPAGESDSAFMQSLYAGALGRPADAAGLTYWGDALAHGTSRAALATTIAESAEAQTHLVGHVEAGWHLA